VLFAHGSGSSRVSPRNKQVALVLHQAGLATMLLDLHTPEEEVEDRLTARLRFDIMLLASRLTAATDFVASGLDEGDFRIGYFGASTGAAAALMAAASRPDVVHAVVSRGGRPDLAGDALAHVRAPTLLIVGGYDHEVLQLNVNAFQRLTCEKEMEVVPRATHLFEEPGALEEVSRYASEWFLRYLPVTGAA